MSLRISVSMLCGVAAIALNAPALAAEAQPADRLTAWEASRTTGQDDGKIATGVARARDRLDSATSTSSMHESEVTKVAPTSLGDLFRNIPGIRAEASSGTINGNYTIRGLPMASTGAKYLQFQEDGLPVLEFGDILGLTPDVFIRVDQNIAEVESIRGGSASTFASNAPGGVINLISKTGEVEGGSVAASTGLNYEGYRTDVDYGGHLSDTLRFHVGGFYREGNGPRHVGYTADHGGQIKFNITKEFAGGYVRVYGKLLDDHNALYPAEPIAVSGSNSDPEYTSLTGFSIKDGSLLSRYINAIPVIDGNNQLINADLHDGAHTSAKSLGLVANFTLGEWAVSERLRYADQSGESSTIYPFALVPATVAAAAFGAPGGDLVYASGPLTGQTITDPAALNGNGQLAYSGAVYSKIRSANDFTNDLRASRVWNVGGGELTSTAGLYTSRQEAHFDRTIVTMLHDVADDGRSALVNIVQPDASPLTQDGVVSFFGPAAATHSSFDVDYTIVAPYGSLNYHLGKLALGASVRVDTGKVEGSVRTNTAADIQTIDVNNDGVISVAEQTFTFTPFSRSTPVNYRYDYLSYSLSANYRWSDVFSSFARYSHGARAGADRLLLTPAISSLDGSLLNKNAGHDPVQQAEAGVKYRNNGVFLNLTGFWAKVTETNTQVQPDEHGIGTMVLINPSYRAFGAEFEGGVRKGPFSLTGSATLTDAKITKSDDADLIGNKPRHQAALIYQIMPQYETDLVSVGASIVGTTSSYAQDTNQLKIPGYTTVGAFAQVRPIKGLELSLNVNNLFNVKAITDVNAGTMPATGLTFAQTLYGRTISSAVRFYF